MTDVRTIRPERCFETYSRSLEVTRAIRAMWKVHDELSYALRDRTVRINDNIERLRADFDLTVDEWHYWAEITAGLTPEAAMLLDKRILSRRRL